MKTLSIIAVFLFLVSCSSTRFVDSWKNREIVTFKPDKLLVIGMTDNLTARGIFEEELQSALSQRGLNVYESMTIIDKSFSDTKRSEEEIASMTQELREKGFDAVIITAVTGVDDRSHYHPGYYSVGWRWYRFGRYYYRYQGIYYTPRYYEEYRIYHLETAIYNLTNEEERALVWVGSFDLVDPQNITSSVDDYVRKIISQLEKENIIRSM